MILEFDCGNTTLNWRLLTAEGDSAYTGTSPITERTFLAFAPFNEVHAVRGVAVGSSEWCRDFNDFVSQHWQLRVQYVRSVAQGGGVTNGYATPSDLGADRWAAMLGAFNDCRCACCVIDCGTAVTVDYVDDDGVHIGGYIAPGLSVGHRALLNAVPALPSSVLNEMDEFSPARDTLSALNKGNIVAWIGGVREMLTHLPCTPHMRLYVTGGYGKMLCNYLPSCVIWRPHLVMDGIRFALKSP